MTQPVLRTARLVLTPLAEEHLDLEVELDADAEVVRYLYPRPRTRAEVLTSHRERLACAGGGLGFWAGFADGLFVGWWILRPTTGPDQPRTPGWAELGYRLMRRSWRQGYAAEACRELLRHGFVDVGLQAVIAQTMTVNAGSRAVMQSVGLGYVRTFQTSFDEPVEGADRGEVEYAITRAEWFSRAARSP